MEFTDEGDGPEHQGFPLFRGDEPLLKRTRQGRRNNNNNV